MMSAQATDGMWTDAGDHLTREELAGASGFTLAELGELIDYGAVRALEHAGAQPIFSLECLAPLREAARLRRDFDLDLFALAILLDYLARIDVLERQVHSLQSHLPFHTPPDRREGPQPWREPHG
jgi:chaperone modulatory protein CbpM